MRSPVLSCWLEGGGGLYGKQSRDFDTIFSPFSSIQTNQPFDLFSFLISRHVIALFLLDVESPHRLPSTHSYSYLTLMQITWLKERERREQSGDSQARALMHTCESGTRARSSISTEYKKKNRERKKVQEKRDRLVKIIQILCFKFRKIRSNPPSSFFFMTEESTREGRSVGQNARQMFEIFTFQGGRYMKCE